MANSGPSSIRTMKTLYEVFGSTQENFNPKEITRIRRRLMFHVHDDRIRPEHREYAKKKRQLIEFATEILGNDQSRKKYNALIKNNATQNAVSLYIDNLPAFSDKIKTVCITRQQRQINIHKTNPAFDLRLVSPITPIYGKISKKIQILHHAQYLIHTMKKDWRGV